MLSDWRNYETWQEAGSPEAAGKAHGIFKEMLAAFVARRKAEGGVASDS